MTDLQVDVLHQALAQARRERESYRLLTSLTLTQLHDIGKKLTRTQASLYALLKDRSKLRNAS